MIATMPCPICEWPMPVNASTVGETDGFPLQVEIEVSLSDEARDHLLSHFPDDDGGEPVPEPAEIVLDPAGLDTREGRAA